MENIYSKWQESRVEKQLERKIQHTFLYFEMIVKNLMRSGSRVPQVVKFFAAIDPLEGIYNLILVSRAVTDLTRIPKDEGRIVLFEDRDLDAGAGLVLPFFKSLTDTELGKEKHFFALLLNPNYKIPPYSFFTPQELVSKRTDLARFPVGDLIQVAKGLVDGANCSHVFGDKMVTRAEYEFMAAQDFNFF